MKMYVWVWLTAVLTLLTGATAGCSSGPSYMGEDVRKNEFRGMWVTRWDYITQDDVREVMKNCADLGITDVFWQVRGQADAFYPSDLEPWGEDLFRDPNNPAKPATPTPAELARGPGFDPLALAVAEAHNRGMRIHAWVNAMPLWKGTTPPVAPSHPWHTRPNLRLADLQGQRQPLNEHYVIFNPALDETHDHLIAVLTDLNTRYNLDGIHLDYIRFVSELMDDQTFYPGDAATQAHYRQQTGKAFEDTAAGHTAFRNWIRDRITRLVQRIHNEVVKARPGRVLTAAVWRRPDLAQTYLQDAERWLQQGLIDLALPMIYSDDDQRFTDDVRAWMKAAGSNKNRVVPGVGSYKHPSGEQTVRQLNSLRTPDRYTLFAYSVYFKSRAADSDPSAEGERIRAGHRQPLLQHNRSGD